jgi:hypothetical protein
MGKPSVDEVGRVARPRAPRVTPSISPRDLERRFRARKLPPVVLIVVSLALWVLIGFSCHAVVKALG